MSGGTQTPPPEGSLFSSLVKAIEEMTREARAEMDRYTGEGYTYEQGRYHACLKLRDKADALKDAARRADPRRLVEQGWPGE